MRHARRRVGGGALAGVVAALAALLALSGCADRRIDMRNIEAAMRDRYGRDAAVPITAVTCPEWVRTREGETFECRVRFEGDVEWTIQVTQQGEGTTQWTPRGRAVFAEDIEPWLVEHLAGEMRVAQARCDARVYVIEPGEHITCTVVSAGGEETPARIALDDTGGLRLIPGMAPRAAPGEDPPPSAR